MPKTPTTFQDSYHETNEPGENILDAKMRSAHLQQEEGLINGTDVP